MKQIPSTVDVARVCKKIAVAVKGESPVVIANALVAYLELLNKLEGK